MFFLAARHIPNLISLLRILLTLPVCVLLLHQRYTETLVIFIIAGVSDGLDGFIAKRFGWQSRLGGLLDPLADKILFVSSFLVLGSAQLIPIWLVVIAVLRDLLIVVGTLSYQIAIGNLQPAPSRISKFNTFLQTLLVILVIIDAGPYQLPRMLLDSIQLLLLITLLLSGGHYVYLWAQKAHKSKTTP